MKKAMAGLILLVGSCTLPPVVFHDGLPAQASEPDHLAVRGQVALMYWSENGAQSAVPGYLSFGARMGTELGAVAVEGGAGLMSVTLPYFHLGLGTSRPAVMLRGSLFTDGWWQASVLAGPPRRPQGLNWSAGLVSSVVGLGPGVTVENRWGDFTLRGQGSVTWRAPWADTTIKGQVISLGIGVEPSINLKRRATAETTQPRPR